MRARLTPEERDRRAAARRAASWARIKDGSAYKKYDPAVEGYGSAEQWQETIEKLASGLGLLVHRANKPNIPKDLIVLGLEALPEHVDGLKSAFRRMAMTAHPDVGGGHKEFIDLMSAFKRLLQHYK
jgi:hypothetical protein